MKIREVMGQRVEFFSGIFRACGSTWLNARNGTRYLRFALRDASGFIKARGWEEQYQGPKEILHNSKVFVEGAVVTYGGKQIANVTQAEIVGEPEKNPFVRIPQDSCPIERGIEHLYEVSEDLSLKPLREFVFSTFSDEDILIPFLRAPGSLSFHHSYPGGLLEHSLQCAKTVKSHQEFKIHVREIGIVAALLHDIGKIKTLSSNRNNSGLTHDELTIKILYPHLKTLQSDWPDGAQALIKIWLWMGVRRGRTAPSLTIAEAVLAADRISAGLDNERTFMHQNPHPHKERCFRGRNFWQPRPFIRD